ncbi:MAG: nucleotidyltransferase substrate binding protein [Deltaproteobacteria bacterium]|nr:nucleotidyltransferase substrate binding protein [Deltaproteobacteria bacterium]
MTPALDLSGLMKAVEALGSSLDVYDERTGEGASPREKEVLRAGAIQAFGFTYELCWKAMKRWIEVNVHPEPVDGVTRRELFRVAAENRLISDVNKWMGFHNNRNSTSHTYNENVAEEVFIAARQFFPCAKDCLTKLGSR